MLEAQKGKERGSHSTDNVGKIHPNDKKRHRQVRQGPRALQERSGGVRGRRGEKNKNTKTDFRKDSVSYNKRYKTGLESVQTLETRREQEKRGVRRGKKANEKGDSGRSRRTEQGGERRFRKSFLGYSKGKKSSTENARRAKKTVITRGNLGGGGTPYKENATDGTKRGVATGGAKGGMKRCVENPVRPKKAHQEG